MAAFPLGVGTGGVEMQQSALGARRTIAVGMIVLMAGFLQLTAWKLRHLACCGDTRPRRTLPADAGTAGDTACASAALQPLLCRSDSDPPGHRRHGPSRDGGRRRPAITSSVLARPVSASREAPGRRRGPGLF